MGVRSLLPCLIALGLAGCSAFPESPAVVSDVGNDGEVRDLPGRDAAGDADGGADVGADVEADVRPDAPECTRDEECNDGRWCTGVDFCSSGQCQSSPAPSLETNDPCTEGLCVECDPETDDCRPGLDGRVVPKPNGECACVNAGECPDSPCGRGDCQDGQCVAAPLEDGVQCTTPCGAGDAAGRCIAGQCVLPVEGPYGSLLCSNGVDDDCDGVTDGGASCDAADRLEVEGELTGNSGTGDDDGAVLRITPTANAQAMLGQAENLYCTARRVLYQSDLDDDIGFLDHSLVDVDSGVGGTTTGAAGSRGGRGLTLCNGASVEIGPFFYDSTGDGLRVSMTVGLPADVRQLADPAHRLIVSHRGDNTFDEGGDDTWIAAGVWGRSPLDFGDVRLDFFIDPIAGADHGWIRIDQWGRDVSGPERSCFWVDDLLISSARSPTAQGVRYRPRWTANGGRASRETFDGKTFDDVSSWIRLGQGSHIIGVRPQFALGGTDSMTWRFDQASWSSVLMPQLDAAPALFDRRMPFVVEYGADYTGAANGDPLAIGFGLTSPQIPTNRYAGSAHAADVPWLSGPLRMAPSDRRAAFQRVVLPEVAKTLLQLDLFWSTTHITDVGAAVTLDEIDVFFHGEIVGDVLVTPHRSEGPNYPVTLRGDRTGTHMVQCFWQVPLRPDLPTVASEPFKVQLQ